MAKCSVEDCSLESYEDTEKCVLHCDKGKYPGDFHKIGLLSGFHKELIKYIVDELLDPYVNKDELERDSLTEFLTNKQSENEQIATVLKSRIVVLSQLNFPKRDSRDRFDYLSTLKKLGGIHFNICSFTAYGLELIDVKLFYQDCTFLQNWHIYNSRLLGNINSVVYQDCIFHEEVSSFSEGDEKYTIEVSLFNNCTFNKKLEFTNIDFKDAVFNNTNPEPLVINEIHLYECILNDKFILNNCHIGIFLSQTSIFNSKLEIKNNEIKEFKLIDSNFFKLVDAFESEFIKFNIKKCIFEDFVGFEKCIFGNKERNTNEYTAVFLYATFISFVNFRSTNFRSGLDIEHINLKEAPNFLNAAVDPENTNRETFRIVKNSFDSIGNHIDANRFFVQEMRRYKSELNNSKNLQEKFIFFINEKASNFGQSYIRPIMFLFFFSIIYTGLIYGHENNTLYKLYPPANQYISLVSNAVNDVAKNMLPFKSALVDGMEFISIIFYIVMASLVWLTIVAVKRHTKR